MTAARAWAPWAVLAAVVIAAATFLQSGTGRDALKSLGLISDSTRYVALSFANVDDLPYSVPPRGARPTIAVVIDNHEGHAVSYRLTATQRGSAKIRATASTVVPDGARRLVSLQVPVTCPRTDHETTKMLSFALTPTNYTLTHFVLCQPAT